MRARRKSHKKAYSEPNKVGTPDVCLHEDEVPRHTDRGKTNTRGEKVYFPRTPEEVGAYEPVESI